ncbi:MAG: hypothetical protein ACLPTJ_16515 [Solirubrobacteraceae bacterium]
MLLDESLPAQHESAAEPPDVGSNAATGEGDFAAGVRQHAGDASVRGDFATGMYPAIAPGARTSGDFAAGLRAHTDAHATGDFATGMRVPDARPRRPAVLNRARSDRKRPEARKAA